MIPNAENVARVDVVVKGRHDLVEVQASYLVKELYEGRNDLAMSHTRGRGFPHKQVEFFTTEVYTTMLWFCYQC